MHTVNGVSRNLSIYKTDQSILNTVFNYVRVKRVSFFFFFTLI